MVSASRIQILLTCAKAQEMLTRRIFRRLYPAGHETMCFLALDRSPMTLWLLQKTFIKHRMPAVGFLLTTHLQSAVANCDDGYKYCTLKQRML